ncbi:SWIM zinc finger family protein [Actinoplanes aureus]|uniref:SWIM zinc finger family protein n=1 Tax=Actinoplanes aureus TaxID=2792083 RepID=A0A931C859_9ACTN|nr:SWIM zinc finger family protein [Actinoplanes aureus]MBG0562253.1 SWIM zinc finger family protein [Actinoplanes aureus]
MTLPPVAADVTAEAVAALPARLSKRLDAVAAQAHSWPVSHDGDVITVRPDDQTTVTLTTPVVAAGDAACSCLLAPRCLHRAAVLSIAPVLAAGASADSGPIVESQGGGWAAPAEHAETRSPGESDGGSDTSEAEPAGTGPHWESRSEGDASQPEPLGGGPAPGGSQAGPVGRGSASPGGAAAQVRLAAPVTEAQCRAALDLAAAASAVLAGGIPGAGAVAQADLLRAVHQARAAKLHAPAAAAVRVVEHLRAARREDPAFRLATLTDDLRELLACCHRLAGGDATAIGVARRDYEPVGDLRLHGLFCEPIRAATGHAGAATYLADTRGRIWTVSDVKPADPAVAVSAARASVDLGEVRLSHHELSRGGLLAVNAHASVTGRLSHGRARQAVSASGSSWFDAPLDALWHPGLPAQIDRWLTGAAMPAHERPAAHDLAFLDGIILGADRRGLLLAVTPHDPAASVAAAPPGQPAASGGNTAPTEKDTAAQSTSAVPATIVAVAAPLDDPALPYVTNLRILAVHAAGHPIRLVGRFTGPRRVAGLAFTAKWLPARHGGHVDLGTGPLARADLPGTLPTPADQASVLPKPGIPPRPADQPSTPPTPGIPPTPGMPLALISLADDLTGDQIGAPPAPPLHLLRHQLERVASAGRPALLTGVGDDARRLADAHLSAAAAVLSALGAAGVRRTRDVFGRLDPHDVQQLARAWLTAAVYEQAAAHELTRIAWAETTEV